ncbi:hypothetical protein AB0F52_46000 [Amycolatopsis sp. NPDC024027]|uniref:hypothetical protein n=1 Tax=Amycolatopsis sp. NPDC024027 TaxID=3154327 RepID=UPI0033F5FDAF
MVLERTDEISVVLGHPRPVLGCLRSGLTTLRRPRIPFHIGILADSLPEFSFALGGAGRPEPDPARPRPGDVRLAGCQLILTESRHAGLLAGLDLGVGPDRIIDVHSLAWWELVAADAPLNSAPAPPGRLADAYDADPELAEHRMSFTPTLEHMIAVLVAGTLSMMTQPSG